MVSEVDIIEGINSYVGKERAKLHEQESAQIKQKLENKLASLKERFSFNLPYKDTEFVQLINKLKSLGLSLDELKTQQVEINECIANYKRDNLAKESTSFFEHETRPLVLKLVCLKRIVSYVKCMMRIDDYTYNMQSSLLAFK